MLKYLYEYLKLYSIFFILTYKNRLFFLLHLYFIRNMFKESNVNYLLYFFKLDTV